MGDGQAALVAGAHRVERVFDDVVAGDADGVDEELAGEVGQAKAGADLAAVDGDAGGAGGDGVFPFGKHVAGGVEEAAPEADVGGAVVGPVVGGHEAAGEAVAVSEEGEVGREVEAVEILARVGQHRVGEAGFVEGEDGDAGGEKMADAVGEAGGVEGSDEEGGFAQGGEVFEAARFCAEAGAADLFHVVDEEGGGSGQARGQGEEGFGDAVGVVDGEAARVRQAGGEFGEALGGDGVGEGLVDDVAAGLGVEGVDVEHQRADSGRNGITGPGDGAFPAPLLACRRVGRLRRGRSGR